MIEREQLAARYMWVFAAYLNIRPWELERLTVREFDAAVAWIDRMLKGDGSG